MTRGVDPRLPVLIGVGQVNQRVERAEAALEPVGLMAEALRLAAADARAPQALAQADSVRVMQLLSWPYPDPGALVARQLGARVRETVTTVIGGNEVQSLVSQTAFDIQNGRNDLVLLTGAEAWRTRTRHWRDGTEPAWTQQAPGTEPTRRFGQEHDYSHAAELALGIAMPVQLYPIFESARRAATGLGIDEHRRALGELWAGFAEVATTNPAAWSHGSSAVVTADDIATPSPDNRLVAHPYTKLLCSNSQVDQGAALIMCSAERAEALGVPRELWVFPHAGADAHDHWFVSNRADLHTSPALRVAGRAALDLAGITTDDLAHVDVYSCFPSAVQVAADELGLGTDRQLTVTGGMTFAGGPWNNYVMHSIATMVEVLRDDPGSLGLCTGNGGFLTKHAFGVYSTEPPPARRFRHAFPQADVDGRLRREVVEDHEGPVTIEGCTVTCDAAGEPEQGVAAVLTPTGERAWAVSADPGVMAAITKEELVGRAAHRSATGQLAL